MRSRRSSERPLAPAGRLKRELFAAALLGAGFLILTALVASGATRALDRELVGVVQFVQVAWLDVGASLLSLAGRAELTGAFAVALAAAWSRNAGARGLTPLLLFFAVGIELALKYTVAHPPPPPELSRGEHLLPIFRVATPYAYPSGHLARIAFLAALLWGRVPRWRAALAALVAAMALTRVYLAVHWPSDVAGGILLGLALGSFATAFGPKRRPAHEGDRGPVAAG